jgi:beta-galactosidase
MKGIKFGKLLALAIGITAGFTAIAAADPFVHELSAVTAYSSYNSHCFIIKGKPTFIFSGEMEYWRVPRGLWHDRLLRMKQEGYNSVSVYIFWNAHEPTEGEFHFEDNVDIDAYLTEIEKVGMYVFLRLGPYICAEVDGGGMPAWMCVKPGMAYRTSEPQFLNCMDNWFKKVMPVLVKHHINNGGSIIFYQLENEYDHLVNPTFIDQVYLKHLVDTTRALGMQLPYLITGMNNAEQPDPGTFFPSGPWMCTEMWDGWIGWYGEPSDARSLETSLYTWRMCEKGVAGFSMYMAHGGTNFGYTADAEQWITSYDYTAPIGEAGQFRKDFSLVKHAGLFVQAFNQLIASSSNGSSLVAAVPSGLTSYVNSSSLGKIAFVENAGSSPATITLKWNAKSASVPTTGSCTVSPSTSMPFLADYCLASNDTIDYTAGNILSLKNIGQTTYIIFFGDASTRGEISLRYVANPSSTPQSPWQWNALTMKALLSFTYPSADTVIEFTAPLNGGRTFTALVMNTNRADRTWVTDSSIVSGAYFVMDDAYEFPVGGGKALIYSKDGSRQIVQGAVSAPGAISLSNWTWFAATAEADTGFNDAAWATSTHPQPMPAYGWSNGYGWYRTSMTSSTASTQSLSLPGIKDAAYKFWNGALTSGQNLQVRAGKNTLAILVAEYGRFKFPSSVDIKGILGDVTLGSTTLTNWRFKGGIGGMTETGTMGTATNWDAFLNRTWTSGTAPADNLPRCWKAQFAYTANPSLHQTFNITGTMGVGVVWLNGHCVGRSKTNQPALFVPECWLLPSNVLVIFYDNGTPSSNLALTPIESHSVYHDQVGISQPVYRVKDRVLQKEIPGNYTTVIYDLQGRVIARTDAGISIANLLKTRYHRGIYIVRQSNSSGYTLINTHGK